MTRLVGALVALLLVLTACGDDGPSAEEKRHDKAVASIADGLQQDSDADEENGPILADDEATCAGTSIVDRLGTEALVKQGILEEDLSLVGIPDKPSRKVAKGLIHALSGCVGIVEFTVRTLRGMIRGLGTAGEGFDDSDKTWARILKCAKRQIPEKAARKAALRNPHASLLPAPMLNRLRECGVDALG